MTTDGVESHTEYGGGGVMPNTVFPKGNEALTPSDKLRLQSLTGQEEDSRAPLDPYFWHGLTPPDKEQELNDRRLREQREKAQRRNEANRYRESKY